jgi:hypothetical protein
MRNILLSELYLMLLQRVNEMGQTGRIKIACTILAQKPEGKSKLERPNCGWESNVIIDLKNNRVGVGIAFSWLRT